MRRLAAVLLSQLLLWTLVAELNHGLSGWQLSVFAGGLFVAYPALQLGRREGLAAAGFAGLLCDAHAPVPFGTHGLLFAAAQLLLHRARERLPRGDLLTRVLAVLFTNLALFLALGLLRVPDAPSPGSAWARLIADLVSSQVVLALATPWFLALQERLDQLADVAPDRRAGRA